MSDETLRACIVIAAPAEEVFAVLADPVRHADVDGTGRVTGALDTAPLTRPGQVFRMGMHHPDHPDGTYVTANRVSALDPPRTIAWEPGPDVAADGEPHPGGWVWRYDLESAGPSSTEVTLTYDWSAVPPSVRAYLAFPPFPVSHLVESLRHLAELVTRYRPVAGEGCGERMSDHELSDLRARAAEGDRDAVDQLVELAGERGDLDELRRLADGGSRDAVDQLVELAGEREDVEELRRLADGGSRDAADVLAELAGEEDDG